MQPERALPAIVDTGEEDKIPQTTWKMVKNIFFPKASEEMVAYYFGYCKNAGMDPQLKPFAIVSIPQKDGPDKEDIWPTIVFYRMIAHRTGEYAGLCNWQYGPTIELKFDYGKYGGVKKVRVPEWGTVTAKRFVKSIGQIVEYELPRMYWIETAPLNKWGNPSPKWITRPFGQFSKCMEAAILRMGWPEIGGDATEEERSVREPIDITPDEADNSAVTITQKRTSPLDSMRDQTYAPEGPADASGKPIKFSREDGVVRDDDAPGFTDAVLDEMVDEVQMDLLSTGKEGIKLPDVDSLITPGQFVEQLLMVDVDLADKAWPRLDELTTAWNNKVETAEANGKDIHPKALKNVADAIDAATKRLTEATGKETEDAPTGEAEIETTLVDAEHEILREEQLG